MSSPYHYATLSPPTFTHMMKYTGHVLLVVPCITMFTLPKELRAQHYISPLKKGMATMYHIFHIYDDNHWYAHVIVSLVQAHARHLSYCHPKKKKHVPGDAFLFYHIHHAFDYDINIPKTRHAAFIWKKICVPFNSICQPFSLHNGVPISAISMLAIRDMVSTHICINI